MFSVEDVLERVRRPARQLAPSWRVRMVFADGSEWEQTYEPAANWPILLVEHPPVRFIARQTMNLVRFYLQEHGMQPVRVEIEPPAGTTDDFGREVLGDIQLAIVRL